MTNPMIGMPGTPEMLIILAIVILVFGASKLPDLARSSGQALRIFKTETKGLRDGDDTDSTTVEARQREIGAGGAESGPVIEPSADVVRERRDDPSV